MPYIKGENRNQIDKIKALADKGYYSTSDLKECEGKKIEIM